jgi:multicomponent Na+:H+ antiporter subunit D
MSTLALIFIPFFLGITLYLVIHQPLARMGLALLGILVEVILLAIAPVDISVYAFGIQLQLSPLAQLFLPIFWAISAFILFQASSPPHSENFTPLLLLIVGGATGVLLASNPFVAAVLLQLSGVAVVFLIPHRDDLAPSAKAGGRYLTMAFASGVVILLGLMVTDIHQADPKDLTSLRLAATLLTIGFGLRTAIIPFHIWLPETSEKAPPMTTMLLVTVVDAAGLLLLMTIISDLPPLVTDWRGGQLMMLVGVLGAVGGSILALGERSLGRMLAYSTSYHLGFLIFGISTTTASGWIITLFALVCHVLAKSLLFTCYNSIQQLAATPEKRPSNLVALGFAVGGLVIVGVPPLAGFVSAWPLLAMAAETSGLLVLAFVGAMALMFFAYVRMFRHLFINGNEKSPASVDALPTRGLIVFLTLLLLGLGLFPAPLLSILEKAVSLLAFPVG